MINLIASFVAGFIAGVFIVALLGWINDGKDE